MYSLVLLRSLLQKLPLKKAPGPDFVSAEHLLYAGESLRFFVLLFSLRYCLISALFAVLYPIPA